MTPITNTQRKRGSEYVKERMIAGPITPTAIRVMEKVQKGSDKMILEGQLSKELLKATTTAGAKRKAWKDARNTVVQKYREIYGNVARRQMKADDEDANRVVNMHDKRLQALWKKKYKAIMVRYPKIYNNLINSGRFGHCQPNI
jgi:hypothetical protein